MAAKQQLYIGLRVAMLIVAVASVALAGRREFAAFHAADVIALAVALLLTVVLLQIEVPMLSIGHRRGKQLEPGRLTLELPVLLTVFTMYGPAAAAAIALIAHPLSWSAERRSRFIRRALDGGADALLWLFFGVVRPLLLPPQPVFTVAGFLIFLAVYVLALFVFLFFVWLPVRSLSEHSISLARLWRNLARDTRLFAYTLLMMSWSYACTMIWLRAGVTLGLVALAPLPFMAGALRAVHNARLELHRLRLARDAVQAMLRTRDPLPQMNSLLGSLHTPSADETLQIYAGISPGDASLAPLATLGPIPDAEQLDRVRRTIGDLQRSDRPSSSLRTDRSTVTAYAVRDADDRLLGALVIHRPARTASLLPGRRFLQAAAELAPLLRDFRAIAATQSAAAVDALTGLPNRRSIMADVRRHIENAGPANPCAVLILDLDHFKSINDSLGHQAGDHALRVVGHIIARHIRAHDRAGRVGGEEFVVMMPDTTSEMACAVGERLRAAIESGEVRYADGKPVTASIGVAVSGPSDTVDSLLARADRALYVAKRQGRNRVIELGA